ncbi:DUF2358 domain-containing protein [Calothrix sp. UHCC 0171]|uniref:DUF2358 domain-containing protein n=1 Tax=Calothrix sp. UHCC 0171 TaxID=3110245 RepID=UPI002B21A63C|nr:DUF2358 domain-containing protein [Calothrix sp. UHCC 0171]MEA5572088.1 DUF2358 domain-containing protein [Calothrix sp. UHCC 0171]
MNIIDILKADYQRFPENQTYSIYAAKVYFQDPLNKFTGVERYKKMITFIQTWLLNCKMDLHDIKQDGNNIKTEWTLSWNSPLPWKPKVAISGYSELTLDTNNLICSHVDYWHTPLFDVVKQNFKFGNR